MELFTKEYIVVENDDDHPKVSREYKVTVTNDRPSIADGEFVDVYYNSDRHGKEFCKTYYPSEEPVGDAIADFVEEHENSGSWHLTASYFYVKEE